MSANAAARQAIDQVNRQFMDAFNRGDATAAAQVYTEDARLMPPSMSTMQGREAIAQFWRGGMEVGIQRVELHTDDFQSHGDLGYEIGHAVLHIKSQDGHSLSDTLKFVVVWQKQGDEWKWAVDIWNSLA